MMKGRLHRVEDDIVIVIFDRPHEEYDICAKYKKGDGVKICKEHQKGEEVYISEDAVLFESKRLIKKDVITPVYLPESMMAELVTQAHASNLILNRP